MKIMKLERSVILWGPVALVTSFSWIRNAQLRPDQIHHVVLALAMCMVKPLKDAGFVDGKKA